MHKIQKKNPPIVMYLDFTFYIAMYLERETWHICQRSPAMQISRFHHAGFFLPFARFPFAPPSLRAIGEASRVLLRQLTMEIGTGAKGRTCTTTNWWPTDDDWYGERELMEREIGTANGNDELRSSRSVLRGCLPSVLRGCLPRDRLAAREGVPRNKISEKKKRWWTWHFA